jgi:hypothetical protein
MFNPRFLVVCFSLTAEKWIGRDLEGKDCNLIEAVSRNLSGGTEENHDNLSHYSQSLSRNSIREPSEHKPARLLPEVMTVDKTTGKFVASHFYRFKRVGKAWRERFMNLILADICWIKVAFFIVIPIYKRR